MIRIIVCLIALFLLPDSPSAREPLAFVINTTGETLTKMNLETGAVTNNIVPLGSALGSHPNQIIVRDTLAYVLNSGTNEIQVIDLNQEITVHYINLPALCSPYWMAFYDDSTVFVTGFVSGHLYRVDTDSRSVEATIPVGSSPEGVEIRDGKVFVAVSGFDQQTWEYGQGRLAVVDPRGDSLIRSIDVGTNPQYTSVDRLGRIHLVCTGDYWSTFGMLYIVDPVAETVLDSLELGGSPGAVAITPGDIGYVAAGGWVADGELFVYNALSGDVYHDAQNPLPVDSGCMMVVPYQDSSCFVGAFADFVTSIDSNGAELNRYAVGDGPVHLGVNYVPGDVDGSFTIDISDIIMLVGYMFNQEPEPPWPYWRKNIDGAEGLDIADLVYLATYMFNNGPPPRMGATWRD